jgi:outer membrane protein OmpA-like peptidoglycan-associated protein
MRLSASSMLAGALLLLGSATSAQACIPNWRTISFESGSASLDDDARTRLEEGAMAFIRAEGTLAVRLIGHADRAGSDAANLRLSRRRAEAVRDFLATRGVPWGSLEIVAVGEARPRVDTPDGTPERQNRYVELIEILAPAELERLAALRAANGDRAVC